ncbi:hypothetical protein [Kitasatospora purpeofusca]|uniref:hypothetical protein n=1 Tax=Kitasatospora purpeofusca TaxID=67352 RepID=UPI00382C4631
MTITAETAGAVLDAAASSAHWKATNLGLTADVSHGGDIWTVTLPSVETGAGPVRAQITWRESWGGAEYIGVAASWAQTMAIVEAAMAATRLH